jgi:hypothetical protein
MQGDKVNPFVYWQIISSEQPNGMITAISTRITVELDG